MKDSNENKDNNVSHEKDELSAKKEISRSDPTAESPTLEEPKVKSVKAEGEPSALRGFDNFIFSSGGRPTATFSGTSTTIDNLAYRPVSGGSIYRHGMISPRNVISADPDIPFLGFEDFDTKGFTVTLPVDDIPTIKEQLKLQNEINDLKTKYTDKLKEVRSLKEGSKELEDKINELENDRQELLRRENLNHLIGRVNEEARKKLFESEDFKNLFELGNTCQVVVMAIDIRRSTEMMLKAKNEKLYAEFITSLCQELCEIILADYGVFDKFTGDGILAFFPDFYSGPDSIYYALKAAEDCHNVFNLHYKNNRHCFSTVLNEVGLGIGIDFGQAYLASVNNELTIVGSPVVYACRMSGAKYGEILLNQPAFELLKKKCPDYCEFTETELKLKHEGGTLAYKVKFNHKPLNISPPNWDELIEKYTKEIME